MPQKATQQVVKARWIDRAVKTYNFHSSRIREDGNWTITDTANRLGRAYGSVCQDLQLAYALRIYPKMEEISSLSEALKFVRSKKMQSKQQIWDD